MTVERVFASLRTGVLLTAGVGALLLAALKVGGFSEFARTVAEHGLIPTPWASTAAVAVVCVEALVGFLALVWLGRDRRDSMSGTLATCDDPRGQICGSTSRLRAGERAPARQ